ncbi:MAG: DUF302 domain-containing protein [Calditrichaeota bacterium]|nr:MAG: DUF302 domain-containing protein [Calditrichota bacterium]
MIEKFAYKKETNKPFNDVVEAIEKNTVDNQFRLLHTHNVQATLEEKGFEIKPLKIMEICNAGFANKALGIDLNVALFMPCKFVVAQHDNNVSVTLMKPTMIADFIEQDDLRNLADEVELKLIKIMEDSI